jgi:hypothetical protein
MWEHAGKRVPVHSDLQLPEGRPISGKARARRKKALASIQIFGKDRDCKVTSFPGFAGHRPAFHGGFCVSRWAILRGRRSAGEFVSWP